MEKIIEQSINEHAQRIKELEQTIAEKDQKIKRLLNALKCAKTDVEEFCDKFTNDLFFTIDDEEVK